MNGKDPLTLKAFMEFKDDLYNKLDSFRIELRSQTQEEINVAHKRIDRLSNKLWGLAASMIVIVIGVLVALIK